ncbi:MAG: hypothetical protein ACYCZ2_15535 [Lutibacter sp.]
MKSKEKKVEEKQAEENIDLSKLNYSEIKKHLIRKNIFYEEIDIYFTDNLKALIYVDGEGFKASDLYYFCKCGGQIKPDFFCKESIVQDLLMSILFERVQVRNLKKQLVKNADEK